MTPVTERFGVQHFEDPLRGNRTTVHHFASTFRPKIFGTGRNMGQRRNVLYRGLASWLIVKGTGGIKRRSRTGACESYIQKWKRRGDD